MYLRSLKTKHTGLIKLKHKRTEIAIFDCLNKRMATAESALHRAFDRVCGDIFSTILQPKLFALCQVRNELRKIPRFLCLPQMQQCGVCFIQFLDCTRFA